MKTGKKILSVLLSLMMLIPLFGVCSSAAEKGDLRFNGNGRFTILNVADIQSGYPNRPEVLRLLRDTIRKVQPDLAIMLGDNIAGYSCRTKALSKACINEIMNVFERENVPVAVVFGNHDDEKNTASKEEQMEWYGSFDCFVGEAGPEDITGVGNYNLPILSSDGSHYAFNLWLTDSGTYNDENDLGGYGCPHKDQIEWYKKTALELKEQNGGKVVPAMNFQHIVPIEIREVLGYGEGGVPYFLDGVEYEGEINEGICPAGYTNGQFDAFLEIGDVIATVSGHDHTNTYKVNVRGIDFLNSPSVDYATNDSGDMGRRNGCRVIVLDENAPADYETYIVNYFDVYGSGKSAEYFFIMTENNSSFAKKISAFFKYIFARLFELFGFSGVC